MYWLDDVKHESSTQQVIVTSSHVRVLHLVSSLPCTQSLLLVVSHSCWGGVGGQVLLGVLGVRLLLLLLPLNQLLLQLLVLHPPLLL